MTEGSTDIPIPVVVMGLGMVGQAVARAALLRPELEVVGAIDPAHAGKRLDALLGVPAPAFPVAADPAKAFARARGGVLLHATGSLLEQVLPQLRSAVSAGLSVVSTCEELAYPWYSQPQAADALADLCEARDVAVVGAGVNPGFVLDRLPGLLVGATGPVRHVHGARVQDLSGGSPRRRRTAGVGLSVEEFWALAQQHAVGHVGLAESALLVADGCGFDLDDVDLEEELEPVLADHDLAAGASVGAGAVAGIRQSVRAFVGGKERVRLDLEARVGAEDPRDELSVDGPVQLEARIEGGIPEDEGTAWVVVNAAPAVTRLRGLVTVLELPVGR